MYNEDELRSIREAEAEWEETKVGPTREHGSPVLNEAAPAAE
ncbi:MAG: hypothetical protein J07HQX50_00398 [Haloquadratum sp. J07HQX50]|jgi:hypothetical protein|nr:MAG: hypothetical protein J07HQX50_00398 [Haloquadratum sp. J07HQX50]